MSRGIRTNGNVTDGNVAELTIHDGPTVNGIKTAFCNSYGENDASTRFTVRLAEDVVLSVKLNTLQYEDGSGHNFNFKGYVTQVSPERCDNNMVGKTVDGFYDAKNRNGVIKFYRIKIIRRS